MPKRWSNARGSKYKVQLVEVDENDEIIDVYATVKLRWDKKADGDEFIDEFRDAPVIETGAEE
jgi:hypothetical protein